MEQLNGPKNVLGYPELPWRPEQKPTLKRAGDVYQATAAPQSPKKK
jgi:hypothetical protein